MEITARVTKDAEIKTLQDDRQVVNFSVVINDRYKDRAGQKKEVTTYFDCAYWLSIKVAPILKKGTLVSLYGRVSARAYMAANNEARAALNFHVSDIKFLGSSKTNAAATEAGTQQVAPAAKSSPETIDDLPF